MTIGKKKEWLKKTKEKNSMYNECISNNERETNVYFHSTHVVELPLKQLVYHCDTLKLKV
jgi:hypothetical protein